MRQQLVSVRLGALAFSCRVMSNQRGAGKVCWVGKALEGWGLGGFNTGVQVGEANGWGGYDEMFRSV